MIDIKYFVLVSVCCFVIVLFMTLLLNYLSERLVSYLRNDMVKYKWYVYFDDGSFLEIDESDNYMRREIKEHNRWLKTSDKVRYINKANVTHIEKKLEQRNIDKTED